MPPLLKIVLEIGPLAAFFVTFNWFKADMSELNALLTATGAFVAVMIVSLSVTYALTRTFSRMALLTFAIVVFMGGLTLWLQDETFLKVRPTLVNACFGFALLYGLLRGVSYLQYLMGELMPLTEEGWMKLTRNWTVFFFCMAIVNEIVWRTQPTETWVDAKTFLYPGLAFLFVLTQTPLMSKHTPPDSDTDDDVDKASSPAVGRGFDGR